MTSSFLLPIADPERCGLNADSLARLEAIIAGHIADGRYPGGTFAVARHGELAVAKTFGQAIAGGPQADAQTLWLIYSITKPFTAAALWRLVEEGALRFTDRVADHIPDFGRNGKGDVTVLHLLTHQGGFPGAAIAEEVWTDHERLRRTVCDIALEWAPGTQSLYHAASAHWVAAALIEALTGRDFRDVIRASVIEPLGLGDEVFVGLPEREDRRAGHMYEADTAPKDTVMREERRASSRAFRAAGVPGGGGFASARALAAFYQVLLNGGTLHGRRLVSPRLLAYALSDWTPGMVDSGRHVARGIGPYLRGDREPDHTFGALASPGTFGHGGVGSSVAWGDPATGVSFAYVTNCRQPDPWHSRRMDVLSTLVHAAVR